MTRGRRAFTLLESVMAAALLLVIAVPLALMLSTSNRATAMAAEEVRATLLATEVLDAVETLAVTSFSSQERPLPGTCSWRYRKQFPSNVTGLDEEWADLDAAFEAEGNGVVLTPLDFERSRLFMQPPSRGFRRYLKIELFPSYREGGTDALVVRVRCLVRYDVASGGPLVPKTLELVRLLTVEDPLARLEP